MTLEDTYKLGIKLWKWNPDTLEREVRLEKKEVKFVCSPVRTGREQWLRVSRAEENWLQSHRV